MNKFKGYLYGCISTATYGLIPLFALPILSKGIESDSVLFYRFFFASIAIGCYLKIKGESLRITRREAVTLSALGVLFALAAMLLFLSYGYMSGGVAATLLFLYPVFVTGIMAVFFHEKISAATLGAIVMAFWGISLLYKGDMGAKIGLMGLVLILLSGLAYAVYIVTVNKSNVSTMGGAKLTFYSMAVSALFFFVKLDFGTRLQALPDAQAWTDMILLAAIPTVISCITMVYAIQYVGSTTTAVLGALEPLTAVCVGIAVFSEPFTPALGAGMGLIIIAVTLIIMPKTFLKTLSRRWATHRHPEKKDILSNKKGAC